MLLLVIKAPPRQCLSGVNLRLDFPRIRSCDKAFNTRGLFGKWSLEALGGKDVRQQLEEVIQGTLMSRMSPWAPKQDVSVGPLETSERWYESCLRIIPCENMKARVCIQHSSVIG